MPVDKNKEEEKTLIKQCVKALKKMAPSLNIEVLQPDEKSTCAIGALSVRILDEVQDFIVCKKTDTKSQATTPIDADGRRCLYIYDYIDIKISEKLRRKGISFVDLAGNAHFPFSRSLIYVAGRPATVEADADALQVQTTADGTLNARVVFALLARPEFLQITQRELAKKTGVSLGGVSTALAQLQARGFINKARSKQPRMLLRKEQLLDEWRHEYRSRLAPKLDEQARRMAGDIEALQSAEVVAFGMQWGGEVAAQRITHFLRPVTYTLYANPAIQGLPRLAALAKLRKADDGNIKIVSRFWNFDPADSQHGDTVPLPLVYAELMASDDPRCQETAQLIREKILADE